MGLGMRVCIGVILVASAAQAQGFFTDLFSGGDSASTAEVTVAPPANCPGENTPSAITQYRSELVQQYRQGSYENVRQSMLQCYPQQRPACLSHLEFSATRKALGWTDHQVARAISAEMKKENDQLENYGYPKEFIRSDGKIDFPFGDPAKGEFNRETNPDGYIADPTTRWRQLQRYAARRGFPLVAYCTQSTGGFDRPPVLVAMAVKSGETTRFLQVSPTVPGGIDVKKLCPNPSQRGEDGKLMFPGILNGADVLTEITVDNSKNPPEGAARLMKGVGGHYNHNNGARTSVVGNCGECHTRPTRALSPQCYNNSDTEGNQFDKRLCHQPFDSRMRRQIDQFNKLMPPNLVYKSAPAPGGGRVAGHEDTDGPAYGWVPKGFLETEDGQKLLDKCIEETNYTPYYEGFGGPRVGNVFNFNELPPGTTGKDKVDRNLVAKGMQCAKCHNGEDAGWMHRNFSHSEILYKSAIDRSMPPESGGIVGLGLSDRLAIAKCAIEFQKNTAVAKAWEEQQPWMTTAECKPFVAGAGAGQEGTQ